MTQERRQRRSSKAAEALRLQLDASLRDAECKAMVLADGEGLLVAAAGEGMPHEEIAVYAAMVGAKVENFEGTLYSKDRHWSVRIRRFSAFGDHLFLCAVGGGGESRADNVQRSVGGVARILAAA